MSTPEHIFRVDVGPIREEWCDRCLTTSLVVCDVTTMSDAGVSLLSSFAKCWRCDDE